MGKDRQTYPTVGPFAEPTFANMLERWSDTVVPDELIDVEITADCGAILSSLSVLYD